MLVALLVVVCVSFEFVVFASFVCLVGSCLFFFVLVISCCFSLRVLVVVFLCFVCFFCCVCFVCVLGWLSLVLHSLCVCWLFCVFCCFVCLLVCVAFVLFVC